MNIIDIQKTIIAAIRTILPTYFNGYIAERRGEKIEYIDAKGQANYLLNFSDTKGAYFYIRIQNPITYTPVKKAYSSCLGAVELGINAQLVFFVPISAKDFLFRNLEEIITLNLGDTFYKNAAIRFTLQNCNMNKYEVFFNETQIESLPNLDRVQLMSFEVLITVLRDLNKCLETKLCADCNNLIVL